MKFLFTGIIFLLSYISNAQITIKGKVIDKNSRNALFGATVIYHNKVVAITKQNGEFEFSTSLINTIKNYESIKITFTGYRDEIVEIVNNFISVEMISMVQDLNEVVVSTGALQIIRKAIDRIKYNYPQNQFVQTSVIRMTHEDVEANPYAYELINVDAAVKIYYTPYQYNSTIPNVVLVENRIQHSKSENMLQDTTRWVHHWYQPERYDFVHLHDLFLSSYGLRKNNYIVVGKTVWKGYKVFDIQFFAKNDKDIEGHVFVDTATYAFVYANYTRYNIHELFYRTITKQTAVIDYECDGNQWFLKRIEIHNEYKLTRHATKRTASFFSETLKIDTVNIKQAVNEEAIDLEIEVRNSKKTISDSSWEKYAAIFKEKENEGILQPIDFRSDTTICKKSVSKNKNDFFIKATNYLHSSKFRFGYSISKLPVSVMGQQNNINKVISGTSEFALNSTLLFKFYKHIFFEFDVASNFGIGNINISQYVYSISGFFPLNKYYFIEPVIGFSRIAIQDKNSSELTRINSGILGIRTSCLLGLHTLLFVQLNYNYPLSTQYSLIEFKHQDLSGAIGLILKR